MSFVAKFFVNLSFKLLGYLLSSFFHFFFFYYLLQLSTPVFIWWNKQIINLIQIYHTAKDIKCWHKFHSPLFRPVLRNKGNILFYFFYFFCFYKAYNLYVLIWGQKNEEKKRIFFHNYWLIIILIHATTCLLLLIVLGILFLHGLLHCTSIIYLFLLLSLYCINQYYVIVIVLVGTNLARQLFFLIISTKFKFIF